MKDRKLRIIKNFLYLGFFIFLIWLLAFHWLSGGYVIAGHDSGLPLNAGEFLKTRFFAWDERIGFGQDNSALFGSIILHSLDFWLAFLMGQTTAGNILAVTFWLSLIFVSAFIFSISFKEELGEYFSYIFPPLITVNFFVFQSIFILERAKYELISAMLLFIAILFKVRKKRLSIVTGSVLVALLFFVLNGGGWIGLPLYGGVLIFVMVYLFCEIIWAFLKFKFGLLMRMLGFLVLSGVLFLILNSYSVLPYLATFKSSDSTLLNDPGLRLASLAWIGSLSHGASFLNLFRLQGVPDWFGNLYTVSPGHPFAETYLNNRILVLLSYIFPILILLSFVLVRNLKTKKFISFFWVVTLVGIFFSAGTHPPLGFIYEYIYNHLTGFIIFRSPYYKFGSVMMAGLLLLISFSVSEIAKLIAERFKDNRLKTLAGFLIVILFIGGWLGFYYKLYSTDIFSWQKGFTSRVRPPQYINDFSEYADKNIDDGRVLMLPPFDENWKNDGYTWGYWSLSSLPYSLSSKNFLVNGFGLSKEELGWVNKLYSKIDNKDEKGFLDLSKRMNVEYVLFRRDVSNTSYLNKISITDYEKVIQNFHSISKIRDFENWSLYKIDQNNLSPFSAVKKFEFVAQKDSNLSREFFNTEKVVTYKDSDEENDLLNRFANSKTYSINCSTCPLESYEEFSTLPLVTILPDSLAYKYKEYKERQELKKDIDNNARIGSLIAFILRRTAEHFRMIDLEAKENFIITNLNTINGYLDQIYDLAYLSTDSSDYVAAIRILSGLGPIENNLGRYINEGDITQRSDDFRSAIYDTMLKIARIKNFYNPILNDITKLRYEKKYAVAELPENSSLFIKTSSLPKDDKNLPIYPAEVVFQTTDGETRLNINDKNLDWVEAKILNPQKKPGFIDLRFTNLPNRFIQQGTVIKDTPSGRKNCFVGKIQNFNPLGVYEFSVHSDKKINILKLYFKDENKDDQLKFLVGRPEVNLFLSGLDSTRYLYRPFDLTVDPFVYICSNDVALPEVDKVEVYEIFNPQIIIKQNFDLKMNDQLAEIIYKKVDSTKYLVLVKNASSPFILDFNQRFNSLWILSEDKTGGNFVTDLIDGYKKFKTANFQKDHIVVDGYENGWVMNKTGDYSLVVEYLPQLFFNLGVRITISLLGLMLVFLGFKFRKFIKK